MDPLKTPTVCIIPSLYETDVPTTPLVKEELKFDFTKSSMFKRRNKF